ncbi:MAG: hypothetical protein HRT89_24775, partial [Lentisphaeria bacterium]|nr:hypothetical protein [Lentisphaeria bacterium]NQZ71272.1 hypothetical protein [Lentisphaeria bacterium]
MKSTCKIIILLITFVSSLMAKTPAELQKADLAIANKSLNIIHQLLNQDPQDKKAESLLKICEKIVPGTRHYLYL